MDLWYRDGPCLRGEKVLEIRGTTPVEISRNDYSTCDRNNDTEDREMSASAAFGLPDKEGRIDLQMNDVRIQAAVSDCKGNVKITCQVESLTLGVRGDNQTLDPPKLLFLDAPGQSGFDIVTFEGQLSENLARKPPTFLVHDINNDEHDDLMMWTGSLGNYFSPSYSYYLFDPVTKQFIASRALAEATRGYTVVRIHSNQMDLEYLNGACVYGERVVAVDGTTPVEVSRRETNT